MDLLEIPCAGDRVVGAYGGDAMKDLYWRLYSAWFALFEAPTRAETIEHCALEAHKRQEEIDEAFALGYLNGYDDAMESARQREAV